MSATHLVGGEITYSCLGNNDYEITLTIYRDCNVTTGFDDPVSIAVYDFSNTLIANLRPGILSQSTLPITAPNNCSALPNTVCTEKAIYKTTINLPPKLGGYTIVHQRCCRNATILNIPLPGDRGSTYSTTIPSNDNSCNSSPFFNDTPPVLLCLNQPLSLDMSATDNDGDSLVYTICNIKHGAGKDTAQGFTNPAPNPGAPPPYANIPYNPGFSATNPITSNPTITINRQTGILRGRPTQLGQYVFAICVSEYRNGQLLSTVRRDFQFNVSGDCVGPVSIAEDQIMNPNTLCIGLTIPFKSISVNTTSWLWDFGDASTNLDTSILANPIYTYPDTGVYTVRLIANPGTACEDTSIWSFRVYYPVNIAYTYTGETCYGVNMIDFEPTGSFSTKAKLTWDFGGLTNIGSSFDGTIPPTLTYDQPGAYEVTVSVEDFECSATYKSIIYVYPNPVLISKVDDIKGCAPITVSMVDSSIIFGLAQHTWIFGDGETSNDKSPIHIYEEPGLYTIEHYVKTFQGCIDSVYESYPQIVEVFPSPISELKVSPLRASIYDPNITIENLNRESSNTETILPDGTTLFDFDKEILTFDDTGSYKITHIAYNQFGCSDTLVLDLIVDAPVNIFVPTAFTPNYDGLNDYFQISITGIVEFEIQIFSRWGELVFSSNSLEYSWDGNLQNVSGNRVESGAYAYRLKVLTKENRRTIVKHGSVNVIH